MALSTIVDSIVFACYSRSCAPPPVGKGGSVRGGGVGGRVIRPSGGGDSSTTRSVPRAGARVLSRKFGTRNRGATDQGNRVWGKVAGKRDSTAPGHTRRGAGIGRTGGQVVNVRSGGIGGGRMATLKSKNRESQKKYEEFLKSQKQSDKNTATSRKRTFRPGDWRKYL